MTASELLQVIRRDIGQRLTMELGFSLSNHYAANVKGLNAASKSIEKWIDDLMKDNLKDEASVHTPRNQDVITQEYYDARRRLLSIRELVKDFT